MKKINFNKVDKVSSELFEDIQYYIYSNANRPISDVYSELCSKNHKTQAEYFVWAYIKLNKKKLGLK